MEERRATAIAAALGAWFEGAARDLSFRRTRDPYAIWVSEVMLQQTRVETVEGYFPRFLARFPDAASLAAASEDDVLAAWSGLGYYRRARMLHRGARWLVEHHGGQLPRAVRALREIPGVGPYTAGAIASIAYDDPEPLVDGNVARVLSRLEGVDEPSAQGATAQRHWQDAATIIAAGRPRVLAQALMELGATVCTPRAPRCASCPVSASCSALARGLVDVIPAAKVRKVSPTLRWVALAFDVGGAPTPSWLLVRRPDEGLLARMWTLPLVAVGGDPSVGAEARASSTSGDLLAADVLALVRRLAGVGAERQVPGAWGSLEVQMASEVKHVFTHQTWRISPWIVRGLAKERASTVARATGAAELGALGIGTAPSGGLPTLTRRLIAAVDAMAGDASPSAATVNARRRRGTIRPP